MQTDIHFSPSFAVALVHLAPGEVVRSESGAMPSMTDTVEIATDTQGGVSRGLRRSMLGGEGLVCRLTAPAGIYLHTRSPESFLAWLVPRLPTNRS